MEFPNGIALSSSHVYGHHQPILQNRAGVRTYYHADHLGSTRALTGQTGSLTDGYAFDAYGRTLRQTGPTANNYLFAGEQRDKQLGLDYLRARYLSIAAGRFYGRDPFYSAPTHNTAVHNPYLYANATPPNLTDPSGQFTYLDLLATLSIQQNLVILYAPRIVFGAARVTAAALVSQRILEPAARTQDASLSLIASGYADPLLLDAYTEARRATALGFTFLKAGFELLGAAQNAFDLVVGASSVAKALTALNTSGGAAPQAIADIVTGLNDVRCGFFGLASRIPGLPQKLNNASSILGTCP